MMGVHVFAANNALKIWNKIKFLGLFCHWDWLREELDDHKYNNNDYQYYSCYILENLLVFR